MAQYLKDEVRARIDEAALRVFASRGYAGAAVSAIAREAGTSAGNVYHYYPDKLALFDAVVPASFARELTALVRTRVGALKGVRDVSRLRPHAPFHAVAEALLRFSIENRLRVLVLLSGSAGTRHERFADDLLASLERLAIAHFRGLGRVDPPSEAERFALRQIYRNWLAAVTATLERFDDEAGIRAAVDAYSRYHLAGLNRLFLGPADERPAPRPRQEPRGSSRRGSSD